MNRHKRAGSRYAGRLALYLARTLGLPVERRVDGGVRDRGDIAGIPGWVIEAKATRAIELGSTMNEAKREATNAGVAHYAAIHNRRSHDLGRSFATVELWEFARLVSIEQRARSAGLLEEG